MRSTKRSASFFCEVRSSAAAAASKHPPIAQRAPYSKRQTGQRVSVLEIRYRKQPPTVRNIRAVLKKASLGTRRIFGSIRCKKQASTVREGYSVPETPSYGTGRILKGPQNSTCHIERVSKGAQNSLLPHRTHLQCAKRPPLSLFAPAAPSLAPSTALGTRNGPRSEVSRHKKRVYSLEKS